MMALLAMALLTKALLAKALLPMPPTRLPLDTRWMQSMSGRQMRNRSRATSKDGRRRATSASVLAAGSRCIVIGERMHMHVHMFMHILMHVQW